jgi:hypothetical protein
MATPTETRIATWATDLSRPWTAAVVAALVVITWLVHDVSYLLHQPYWFDEQWVALAARAHLHQLPRLSQSVPVGFTFLVHAVPWGGDQRARLLVLLFASAAVAAAYFLGRELNLIPLVGGVMVAVSVLLVPVMLRSAELKAYTCDAFVTVVLFVLLARVESRWTRRRLAALGAAAGVGALFSHAAVFAGASVVLALGAATAIRREWTRLVETAVTAVATAAAMGVVYLVFDRPHKNPTLVHYWDAYYPPHTEGISGVLRFVHEQFISVRPALGVRQTLVIAALVLAGTVTLLVLHRLAFALATPILSVLLFAAAWHRDYPLLDQRTSTFWLVAVIITMAIGVAGIVKLTPRSYSVVAVLLVVVVVILWIGTTRHDIKAHPLPFENLRQSVHYLDAHRGLDDTVLLDFPAAWGFAYYERSLQPSFAKLAHVSVGFPDFLRRTRTRSGFSSRRAVSAVRSRAPCERRCSGRVRSLGAGCGS